jgi:hypothetical protein
MPYTGYYLTSEEVKNFIGAIYDSANTKYTVMGFDIAEAVFDMQVEVTDNTIKGFIGTIDTTTNKYLLAKSCALNLAGLRIIIVATGGVVTMAGGNVNYRLGDLSISKGEVVRLAIEYAVKNYETRYMEYLYKITSGATVIDRTSNIKSQYCYTDYIQW